MTHTLTDHSAPDSTRKLGPEAVPNIIDRLDRLAEGRDEVSFDDIVTEVGSQGHAPLLFVIATLMVLPIGMIPGVGGALGLIAGLIGIHMLMGQDRVWVPGFIGRRTVAADRLHATAERLRPGAQWMRRRLRIRLGALASGRASLTAIALVIICIGASLAVLGAIPVAAPLLGLPIAAFAIGILSRDGAVVLGGWVLLAGAGAMMLTIGRGLSG